MAAIDWTKIYKKYRGLWIVLRSPEELEVVSSGKKLGEVVEKAKEKGVKAPYVAQIPHRVLPMVGSL